MDYNFTRYLASKVSVDDRSLNAHVRSALKRMLREFEPDRELRALELGAGIGTMIERLIRWGLLGNTHYTAIDIEPGHVAAGLERMRSWADAHEHPIRTSSDADISFDLPSGALELNFETIDVLSLVEQQDRTQDLVIAHAFMDLVDLEVLLPALSQLARKGGLLYLTLNFDGVTHFEPTIDAAQDEQIERLYHESMDKRLIDGKPSGHSRTGRRLLTALPGHGIEVVAAGPSDWIVHPTAKSYPEDEAYFLHYIINTIDLELRGHPDLDQDQFKRWVSRRHDQIEEGELIYLAHQIDILARVNQA